MRGFLITLPDGQEVTVEGSRYEVSEDGSLEVWNESSPSRTWPLDSWVSVKPVGRALGDEWPPENLDETVAEIAWALSGRGHYVTGLSSAEPFESPAMNELDAFSAEALRRVGLDPSSSSNRRELEMVVDIVARNLAFPR